MRRAWQTSGSCRHAACWHNQSDPVFRVGEKKSKGWWLWGGEAEVMKEEGRKGSSKGRPHTLTQPPYSSVTASVSHHCSALLSAQLTDTEFTSFRGPRWRQCEWLSAGAMEMNWTSPFLPHWFHDRVFCTMHSRRKDCTCKKKTRKNQSTHYKVWSINSIIPSTQLMHQHNYSITFFFPPELCSMNSVLIPLGKFVRSTWMGVLRTIILSEVLLPYFLHLQKILRPDLLEKAKAQSASFWVCVCERWCGCVERTPAWEFGVWVSSLFEQVSSSLVKVKVLVIQLCPTLDDPMDRSKPGSSVHEIL